MSKRKILTRSDSSNGGSAARRASHQTPLRRSPRLHPQKNDDPPSSKKNHKEKPQFRSSPSSPDSERNQKKPSRSLESRQTLAAGTADASQSRRRSPRLTSIAAEVTKKDADYPQRRRRSPRLASIAAEVTKKDADSSHADSSQRQRRSPRLASVAAEVTKKDADSSQRRRRSPRLASVAAEVTKKDADSSQRRRRSPRFASDLPEVTKKDGDFAVKPRRSARLMSSSKVATKVGVYGSGDERSDGEGGRGVGKRRKRGENVEVEMDTGRSEAEECCGSEGWTREQEVALRRAYFSARPSPHFWKKVSKMVPGKSAQECFNKIHADLATPTQPQPRSRAKRLKISPVGSFTLSGSRSKELMETKPKRVRSRKQKSLVAQKTARHLLRKHCLIDRSQEADHFSNLETSPNSLHLELPDIISPETPDRIMSPSSVLQKCSSAQERILSRFKTSQADPSPEVLKKIKNIAQHEKYIDHLHCRDARRRTCTKTANSVADRCNKTNSKLEIGALKVARTALISEARDYINHFQQMQANSLDNQETFDSDDEDADADDDDDDKDDDE